MSQVKARFIGHPDGAWITVPFDNGETKNVHVPHGGELPAEIDGRKVPATYRDSLLEQETNWTEVKRDPAKTTSKDGDA